MQLESEWLRLATTKNGRAAPFWAALADWAWRPAEWLAGRQRDAERAFLGHDPKRKLIRLHRGQGQLQVGHGPVADLDLIPGWICPRRSKRRRTAAEHERHHQCAEPHEEQLAEARPVYRPARRAQGDLQQHSVPARDHPQLGDLWPGQVHLAELRPLAGRTDAEPDPVAVGAERPLPHGGDHPDEYAGRDQQAADLSQAKP